MVVNISCLGWLCKHAVHFCDVLVTSMHYTIYWKGLHHMVMGATRGGAEIDQLTPSCPSLSWCIRALYRLTARRASVRKRVLQLGPMA